MALDSNDLGMLHSMGFSPYEQVKIGYMQNKKASGTSIGALATAVGAGVLAIGGAAWAASRAQNAKEVATAKNDGLRDLVTTLAGTLAAERNERISGDTTISQTITDSISGQQTSSLTAQQAAELSSIQSVQQNLLNQAIMGNISENPQKVQIYSAPQPCGCPCGCNG